MYLRMGDYPPGVTGNEPEINGIPDMWIPDDCCKYCEHYKGDVCGKDWVNGDDDYLPERDDKDEDDYCDNYEWNGETLDLPKKQMKPKRSAYKHDYVYNRAMRQYEADYREWNKAYYSALRYRDPYYE